jgi:hypothetical protein
MLRVAQWLQAEFFMSTKLVVMLAMTFVHLLTFAQSTVDHSRFSEVLKQHVADGAVDYPAIKNDKRFAEYLKALSAITPSNIKDKKERLAFWINAYNAFTIELILKNEPVKSIRDIKRGGTGPWDIVWIEIGGERYSLNQIEHEIIRKEFDEPRIHMALVCAAKSCPPLRSEAYDGERLDAQLEDNSALFLFDKSKNRYERETNTLFLSELFSWYGGDFVKKYGSAEKFALRILGAADAKPVAVKYLPYDWSLNSKR